MTEVILTSIVSFAGTNIDDIFVLMVLFAKAERRQERAKIVAGQYLGIGLLTLLSIAGARGFQAVLADSIWMLGAVPVFMGVRFWVKERREGNGFSLCHFHPCRLPSHCHQRSRQHRRLYPAVRPVFPGTACRLRGSVYGYGRVLVPARKPSGRPAADPEKNPAIQAHPRPPGADRPWGYDSERIISIEKLAILGYTRST